MKDMVRLDLAGRDSRTWDRLFETLVGVVGRAVDHLAAGANDDTRFAARQCARDVGEIAKGFVKAKLDRPGLENEKLIVDIAAKFEEMKLSEATRIQIEVETEIRRVVLEKEKLELWEMRMVKALSWLGFFQNHIVRDAEGNASIILTNQDMTAFLADQRTLRSQ